MERERYTVHVYSLGTSSSPPQAKSPKTDDHDHDYHYYSRGGSYRRLRKLSMSVLHFRLSFWPNLRSLDPRELGEVYNYLCLRNRDRTRRKERERERESASYSWPSSRYFNAVASRCVCACSSTLLLPLLLPVTSSIQGRLMNF
jgi:hypothetical protein